MWHMSRGGGGVERKVSDGHIVILRIPENPRKSHLYGVCGAVLPRTGRPRGRMLSWIGLPKVRMERRPAVDPFGNNRSPYRRPILERWRNRLWGPRRLARAGEFADRGRPERPRRAPGSGQLALSRLATSPMRFPMACPTPVREVTKAPALTARTALHSPVEEAASSNRNVVKSFMICRAAVDRRTVPEDLAWAVDGQRPPLKNLR